MLERVLSRPILALLKLPHYDPAERSQLTAAATSPSNKGDSPIQIEGSPINCDSRRIKHEI